MSDDAVSEVGHCKDVAHVRVRAVANTIGVPPGHWRGVFVAHTSCVNVPGYDGWVVQLQVNPNGGGWRDSLRLLPELSDVLPAWLRRARRIAESDAGAVVVEHTFDKEWKMLAVLTPDAARELARSVQRAAAQGPMEVAL